MTTVEIAPGVVRVYPDREEPPAVITVRGP